MKKILPIVIILLLVGGGAYVFLNRGGANISQISQEAFSGSLKLAVEKGIPMKCTYKIDENNFGTGYIKGKNYAGEVSMNGQKSKILLIENCMYTWNENAKQAPGAKICFEPTSGKSIWDQAGEQNTNYNCSPTIVSDSMFAVPTDIKFMDVGQTGGIGQ